MPELTIYRILTFLQGGEAYVPSVAGHRHLTLIPPQPVAMLDPHPESYAHHQDILAILARHDRERAAAPATAACGPGWRLVDGQPMYSAAWL